jgi:peptide/nickel transport system permease protein
MGSSIRASASLNPLRRLPRIPNALRQPLGAVGCCMAVGWLLIAVAAPVLAPYDPLAQRAIPMQPPSLEHLFGTDQLGRDEFSRVLWGGRLSIPLALLLDACALVIGTTLGGIAGFMGGWIDAVIMRLTDLVFAFPTIILAMAVTAALGPSLRNAVLAIVIVFWPGYARLTRGMVKSIVGSDYVIAARLLGAPAPRVLRLDVLPNVIGPITVFATLQLGDAILLLAALSFLGLGSQPPAPEWGAMISIASQYVTRWWLAVFPGLAILTVVLAFLMIGDAARDVFDPASWTDRVK